MKDKIGNTVLLISVFCILYSKKNHNENNTQY